MLYNRSSLFSTDRLGDNALIHSVRVNNTCLLDNIPEDEITPCINHENEHQQTAFTIAIQHNAIGFIEKIFKKNCELSENNKKKSFTLAAEYERN